MNLLNIHIYTIHTICTMYFLLNKILYFYTNIMLP